MSGEVKVAFPYYEYDDDINDGAECVMMASGRAESPCCCANLRLPLFARCIPSIVPVRTERVAMMYRQFERRR